METSLSLNYPAAIPAGHEVEVTEYADTRPEKKRRGFDWAEACRHPVVLDLTTGIRYMNHVHAAAGPSGGNSLVPTAYPLHPRPGLPVARVHRARVVACTLVMVEGLQSQHTTLLLAPHAAP